MFLPGGFELARYTDSKVIIISLPEVEEKARIYSFYCSQCDVKTATGVYSCLSVDMQFKRQVRLGTLSKTSSNSRPLMVNLPVRLAVPVKKVLLACLLALQYHLS